MKLLEKLLTSSAPSGREDAVREIIKKEMEDYCDEIYTDALGNLICHKKGSGKKLMFAAHMDEIGFVVTHIDDNGFVRFSNVGGIKKCNCINAAVEFVNGTRGTISFENKENPASVTLDKMYIDIGASSKEDAIKKINIGDMATYKGNFNTENNRVFSKAIDNRSGCWVLIRAMQQIKQSQNDIYAVFTSQEELGLRGAKTAAFGIMPDMAVSIDVSNPGDTPYSREFNLKLGEGPAIKIKDSSYIIHGAVRRILFDCAQKENIPYQVEASSTGGTDTGAIHLTGSGIPAGTISIPTRYIHSPNEVADINDLENTIRLVYEVAKTDIDKYL